MDKQKQLTMMRFWLFGTFVIIFAAATIYLGGALGLGLAIVKTIQFWLAFVIAAVLSVVMYFVYKAILDRQETQPKEPPVKE
ncbi:MAG: hypothetical protein JXB38_12410 [Anaerolineales bacterium]|nr:hypothetical protein [Anaerolineales bacterium]